MPRARGGGPSEIVLRDHVLARYIVRRLLEVTDVSSRTRKLDVRRRTARRGAAIAGTVMAAFAMISLPAHAKLELPPLLPLPSGTPLLNSVTDLVEDSTDLASETTGDLLGDVPEQLGGLVHGLQEEVTPEPGGQTRKPRARSWRTTRQLEGEPGTPYTPAVGAAVSSTTHRSVSYGTAVSDGFSRAVSRAANLAGPLAAPFAVAFGAVGLLTLAARGPGRLVKVEEERQTFREHRSYRL